MTFCTWNARSVSKKKHELIYFLDKFNIDIILITETHLKPGMGFHIPHYYIYRNDRTDQACGGVAIAIKKSISHTLLPNVALQSIENVSLYVVLPHGSLRVTCCYIPNSNHGHFRQDLNRLTTSSAYIIGGDFNCRHSYWNCSRVNKGGRILYDFLNSRSDCVLHFPDSPTYYQNNRTSSTIDFYLSSNAVPVSNVISKN